MGLNDTKEGSKSSVAPKGQLSWMNGHGKLLIGLVVGLLALSGALLGLLLNSHGDRIATTEETINGYAREGRLETPQQKQDMVDARIQRYWVENMKPDLRSMEERLLRALDKHRHGG